MILTALRSHKSKNNYLQDIKHKFLNSRSKLLDILPQYVIN